WEAKRQGHFCCFTGCVALTLKPFGDGILAGGNEGKVRLIGRRDRREGWTALFQHPHVQNTKNQVYSFSLAGIGRLNPGTHLNS
ncbi:unnamed protein product, partial [Allacma fusca]